MLHSIYKFHKKLLEGDITCQSTVQYCIEEIQRNQHLNAFVEVYADEALQKAKGLDEQRSLGKPMGKLHGVVIALKDVICYKDHQVTAASNILKGFVSQYTAGAVQHLLDEEAIIIGSCNCDEFAMGSSNENSVYGPVKNALDPTKVPGGSSGGSAVAVQADMCMVSLGSDTGGSVRQPADFCGIIGMKPGYGSVTRNGLIAYASSFDQIGIFAKYIDDVKKVYEILSRPDSLDSTMRRSNGATAVKSDNNQFRVAVLKQTLDHPSIDAEISHQLHEMIQTWSNNGFEMNDVDFDMIDYVVPAYYVMTAAEASSNLSRYDGIRYGYQSDKPAENIQEFFINNRTEAFGPEVKRRILLGNFVLSSGYYDAYYQKAQQVRRLLVDKIHEIFKTYDAILLPVSPTTAFSLGEKQKDPVAMYLADIFTVLANLVGAASIALPACKHSNGMPFGFQLLMPAGKEAEMMELSDQLLKVLK